MFWWTAWITYLPTLLHFNILGVIVQSTNITHPRLKKKTIDIPVLFIQATNDAALPPSLSEGMERFVPHLTRREVQAGHWALWQKPGEINAMVGEWLERVVEKRKSNL